MADNSLWDEALVNMGVTYRVVFDGRFFVIENVPARVNAHTGENHFSPETVERLQRIVREQRIPVGSIRTQVYEFM